MIKYSEFDQVWLVKSAGLILGPFSFSELTQALKDKRVALLDEVRTPSSRWSFVRENPQLADLVHLIRERESRQGSRTGRVNIESEEEENTQSVSNFSGGPSATKEIESTPVPSYSNGERTAPMDLPEEKAVKESFLPVKKKRFKNIVPQPHLGTEDFVLNSQPTPLVKNKMVFVAGALIAALLATAYILSSSSSEPKVDIEGKSIDLFKLAERTKSIGFYDKALMMYERALGSKSGDSKVKFEMLPLLLQNDEGVHKAQALAEELKADSSLSADMSAKVANWLGLSFLRQGQYPKAEEQFKFAEASYPQFHVISINHVINEYLSGQAEPALNRAKALQARGIGHPLLSLTEALAMLYLPTNKISPADQAHLTEELEQWSKSRRDFTTEALLSVAALQDRGGQYVQVQNTMGKILEQSAGSTHSYARELDLATTVVSWPRMKNLCENLATRYSLTPSGLALSVFCKIEGEDLSSASVALNEALQKFPKDPHLVALHAQILKSEGNGHEAKDILKDNQTRPGLIIKAQACLEEKDLSCAETALSAVLARDAKDPEGQMGLAQLQLLRSQRDQAQQTADKAISETGNFKPLLEVREEMGEL